MSLAFTKTKQVVLKDLIRVFGTLVFSNNYAAGGEILDLTNKDLSGIRNPPIFGTIRGRAGFVYSLVPGTTLANGKVMIHCNTAGGANAALGEHTAAAVVAGVTGDTINIELTFDRAQ